MESVLVMTSDRKFPLCWMDGAILISFRKQAKYCVESAPSSALMVNESAEASSERRLFSSFLDVSKMLVKIWFLSYRLDMKRLSGETCWDAFPASNFYVLDRLNIFFLSNATSVAGKVSGRHVTDKNNILLLNI